MKVLIVNKLYSPWVGGVEKIAQQVAEGLNAREDFEVEVLCCQPKGARVTDKINRVLVHRTASFGMFWGMPISFDIFGLFRKLSSKTDIINIHHPFPLANLALFLFRPKAKIVVHYHSDIVRQKAFNFLLAPFINYTLSRARKILVSNPNLVKNSPRLRKFKEKCEIVPFGVEMEKFQNFDEDLLADIKKQYGDFVLFVGRLNYYKGPSYLVEAMKSINANLVIIGEGPLKKNLKIKDRVFFLPHIDEWILRHFYRASRVFVLPSIFPSEAFGIVLVEAMASGTPVISTELGTGTSYVNKDGVTGFVVPPKNAAALREAIKKILGDKNLAQQFSRNALKRAEEQFSLKNMIEKTADIFNRF